MDPLVTSAFISGGSSFLSGILGGIGGGEGSAKRFRNRQQDFSEDAFLRQTQHRVDDMKRAGLNPILAASGGVSSGSPTMAPNSDSPSSASQAKTARSAQAMENIVRMATAKNIKEDTELKKSTTAKTNQDRATSFETEQLTREQREKTEMDTVQSAMNTQNLQTQNKILQNQVMESAYNAASAKEKYAGDKVEGDLDRSEYGKMMRKINRALPAVGSSASAIGEILQFYKPKKFQSVKGK